MKTLVLVIALLLSSVSMVCADAYEELARSGLSYETQLRLLEQWSREDMAYQAQRDAIILGIVDQPTRRMPVCSIVWIGNSATQVCW